MKFQFSREVNVYGFLWAVHKWLPLVVITMLILSKAAIVYRNYLVLISHVSHSITWKKRYAVI